jgi:hypothetical protein
VFGCFLAGGGSGACLCSIETSIRDVSDIVRS